MTIETSLWCLYFIILVWTQFNDSVYYVTEKNVYHRGSLYIFLLIPVVLMLLFDLMIFVVRRKKLSKRQCRGILAYLLLPLLAMLYQYFFYGLLMITLATVVASLFLLIELINLQTDMIIRQQDENTRQQIDIMLAQIQPHFIYNTLSSAYYLCDTDPHKAQMTIGNFTTYLRRNFSAIARQELIPFTEELEHTRAYLAVEKMRFESQLSVEYDIPHIAFNIPALTLEPIVENAVKHSMDPESSGVSIKIRTMHTARGSEIIVTDNGPGFPGQSDGGLHVGLSNVEKRLRLMCGGSLITAKGESGGTEVTIIVPDEI